MCVLFQSIVFEIQNSISCLKVFAEKDDYVNPTSDVHRNRKNRYMLKDFCVYTYLRREIISKFCFCDYQFQVYKVHV